MAQKYPTKQCDVLVIGGGGSGALAAVEASKHRNLKIILASKGPVGGSGLTPTANGGTAFHSSPEATFKDMVTGGCFLNDQRLVWYMASQAEGAIEKIREFDVSITRIRDISVCVPPGELLTKLRKLIIQSPGIELLEDTLVTGLIKTNGNISGVTALDLTTGAFFVIQAKAVVLATGGLVGELYPRTSNNPFGINTDSSGTGHAMAYLAGAELIDMEMIQFVPIPANPSCLNLRYFPDFWEGPYINRHGEIVESNVGSYQGKSYSHLFVQKLYRELEKGNGPLFIDQRNLKKPSAGPKIRSWHQRRRLISKLGIDPHENKIEITIGSHFGMGGIRVNEKTETTIPGLFAAGEVMGGLHGGLRMAGYSFTQMIVFGFKAGKQAAQYALEKHFLEVPDPEVDVEKKRVFGFLLSKDDQVFARDLKRQLQQIMQHDVFVIRDRNGLEEAKRGILSIKSRIPALIVPDFKSFNLEWARAIEFSLMIEAAHVIVESALAREESRGFHFRSDFPGQDNQRWLRHTVIKRHKNQLALDLSPVELYKMNPEVQA
ncbi:MAG TPA: FAD-binding protein [Desulfatiglandales bacterium]|nr:FAD-binding protein [Desulfatiglandales bacterium]